MMVVVVVMALDRQGIKIILNGLAGVVTVRQWPHFPGLPKSKAKHKPSKQRTADMDNPIKTGFGLHATPEWICRDGH